MIFRPLVLFVLLAAAPAFAADPKTAPAGAGRTLAHALLALALEGAEAPRLTRTPIG